jgi:hypothetical protein
MAEPIKDSIGSSIRLSDVPEISNGYVALDMQEVKMGSAQQSKEAFISIHDAHARKPSDEDGKGFPLHHLSEQENEILEKQVRISEVKTSMATLYRYATTLDLLIMGISVL